MRAVFPGHYRPDDELIGRMWAEGTFVFDANALLNLYRYSSATREEFLQTLDGLRERIWIPHQVGAEFFGNRASVMSTALLAYGRLRSELGKAHADLLEVLKAYRRHPGIDVERISEELGATFQRLAADLSSQEEAHPDWMTADDPILARLSSVFEGRVGEAPDDGRAKDLLSQAKSRFERSLPPGLRDKDKGGLQQYGDAILWMQILAKAAQLKTPIIFVTDDVKDDWWQRVGGRTIGPLPVLRQEMLDVAQVPFHMYQCDQFLRYASQFLDRKLPESSIEEAQKVRSELQEISSQKAIDEFEELAEAFEALDGTSVSVETQLAPPNPVIVGDYRGSTVSEQIGNLLRERGRLTAMLVAMSPDERKSKDGKEVRDALHFVDKRIIEKKNTLRLAERLLNLRNAT